MIDLTLPAPPDTVFKTPWTQRSPVVDIDFETFVYGYAAMLYGDARTRRDPVTGLSHDRARTKLVVEWWRFCTWIRLLASEVV